LLVSVRAFLLVTGFFSELLVGDSVDVFFANLWLVAGFNGFFLRFRLSRREWAEWMFFFSVISPYPLVNSHITMERSTIFHGKTPYFYGHFPVRFLYVDQAGSPVTSHNLAH